MEFPITIRMPYGGGVRAPELHDDSPEAYYVHTPGVKVAIPSTPADAKGLLAAAIRDPDPVVILEPKLLYRTARGEVPDGEHVVPLGKARVAREGTDLTLVAYGAMVAVAELKQRPRRLLCRVCLPPVRLLLDCMARTAWAEILSLTYWCSAVARVWVRLHMLTKRLRRQSTMDKSRKLSATCLPHLIAVKARILTPCIATFRRSCRTWWEFSAWKKT